MTGERRVHLATRLSHGGICNGRQNPFGSPYGENIGIPRARGWFAKLLEGTNDEKCANRASKQAEASISEAVMEFNGGNGRLRWTTIEDLRNAVKNGADISEAVSGLVRALKDENPNVRESAGDVLEEAARNGKSRSRVIAELVNAMKYGEARMRWEATDVLEKIVERVDIELLKAITTSLLELMRTGRFRSERARNTPWFVEVAGYIDKITRKIGKRIEVGSTVVGAMEGATV